MLLFLLLLPPSDFHINHLNHHLNKKSRNFLPVCLTFTIVSDFNLLVIVSQNEKKCEEMASSFENTSVLTFRTNAVILLLINCPLSACFSVKEHIFVIDGFNFYFLSDFMRCAAYISSKAPYGHIKAKSCAHGEAKVRLLSTVKLNFLS